MRGREEGARNEERGNEGGGRERDRFSRKEEKQSRRIKLPGSLVHPIRIQFRVLVAAEIDQGRGGSRSIRSTMLYTLEYYSNRTRDEDLGTFEVDHDATYAFCLAKQTATCRVWGDININRYRNSSFFRIGKRCVGTDV